MVAAGATQRDATGQERVRNAIGRGAVRAGNVHVGLACAKARLILQPPVCLPGPGPAKLRRMVRFSGVGLRYPEGEGAAALFGIDFALAPGSFTWLLGPSGAGKSSLLGLMSLSLRATEGEVMVLDTRISCLRRRGFPALRRRIGVVFQDYRLLPHLSVYENAALPLRIQGLTEARLAADVREILRWVGLLERADSAPSTLSGGEQQ
eukprot:gene12787-15631_t